MEKALPRSTQLPRIDQQEKSQDKVEYVSWIPGHNDRKGQPIKRTMRMSRERRNVPYQREEFEEREKLFLSDADIMRMPSDEVMYGSPHHVIDDMHPLQRMLIEEQSFISFSDRVFRMVDPVTQARSLIGGKKLVWQTNERGERIPSWIPSYADPVYTSYEFENGGGVDQEDIEDWKYSGTSPVLLNLAQDLMPEHQSDEAQLIVLERLMEKDIPVPKSGDIIIAVTAGNVLVTVRSEHDAKEYELGENQKMPVFGPKLITLTCISEDDCIIVIGKTIIGNEPDDVLTKVMKTGYQDVYLTQDPRSDFRFPHEDAYEEDEEERVVEYNQYNLHVTTGLLPGVEDLKDVIPSDPEEQKQLWMRETGMRITQSEWRVRRKHRKIMDVLSLGIDSPYLGRGFKPPTPRWQRIWQESPSVGSHRADERKMYFEALHAEAKKISSYPELYGSRIWDCRFCGVANHHTGHQCSSPYCEKDYANTTGFYGRIREKNIQDRDLAREWSEKPRRVKVKQPDGSEEWETIPSMFHQKREAYINRLREKGMPDRVIQRKVWHWFDREGKKTAAVYEHSIKCSCGARFVRSVPAAERHLLECPTCKQADKAISVSSRIAHNSKGDPLGSKTTEESVWRQRRSEAYQDLWCTKSQWNTIYSQLKIQRHRINLAEKLTGDRSKAYNILRRLFADCETFADLKQFKELAYKQRIDKLGNILEPSLMDRVSFGDEKRVRLAWYRRWREIATTKREQHNQGEE